MDLQYAREAFERYLEQYDQSDDKVRLKIVHTYGVAEASRQITERMGLSPEDIGLAQLIGLLHDIGRFEQLRIFDSFEPDTMNHARFGVRILFEDRWDDIIRTAIIKHSDFKLEGIEDSRKLLHARIIRDADKLDNCRVKLEDAIETMLQVTADEVGNSKISPEVMEQFRRKESIRSLTRKTKMDYWVSYLAYFFDINYQVTFDIIEENNYIERLIARIPYSNPETAEQMLEIKEGLKQYVSAARCSKHSNYL